VIHRTMQPGCALRTPLEELDLRALAPSTGFKAALTAAFAVAAGQTATHAATATVTAAAETGLSSAATGHTMSRGLASHTKQLAAT
jgi:hypothetical protein